MPLYMISFGTILPNSLRLLDNYIETELKLKYSIMYIQFEIKFCEELAKVGILN